MSRYDPAMSRANQEAAEAMKILLLGRIAEALELSNTLYFLNMTGAKREQVVTLISQYKDINEALQHVLHTSE